MSAVPASSLGVSILGSTGSVGVNTLDVLARHPQRFHVVALSAHTQVDRLFKQCQRFRPRQVAMLDVEAAAELHRRLTAADLSIEVLSGTEGLNTVAATPDAAIVMAAIVGAAGLSPTLEAVRAGKRVLLANKEPLVMCGHLLLHEAERSGAVLLPIDSEHNAIFQCMPAGFRAGQSNEGVERILLTGSGGPFRTTPLAKLALATPDQACNHPRWRMGRKISVDSATLMNKGLELIEACRLFNVMPERVQVLIHPQSIVHSLVEYTDGSVLAQLGNPDMRIPIAHALAWPERIHSGSQALDLLDIARLDFEAPDTTRFPCLRLAFEAAAAGGTTPTILNAANEVAVHAFLNGEIKFTDIAAVIEHTLDRVIKNEESELATILADDQRAREAARAYIVGMASKVRRGVQ